MPPSLLRILATVAVCCAAGYAYLDHRLRAPEPTPVTTQWHYRTEQEWIVTEVVRALADMAHYARTARTLDPAILDQITVATERSGAGTTAFRVHVPGTAEAFVLPVTESIWSPELYAPMAEQLLGLPAEPASAFPGSAVAEALLHPRVDVMVAQSEAVSARLARKMTDVRAQEDAALVVAALGLKEWAGDFYDTRRTMCRIAAHLAVSTAMRAGAPESAEGSLARVALSTLTWRQREAVEILDTLAGRDEPPAIRAWSRALRMRITEDWRLLPEPETATLLEQREFFFLVYIRQSAERAAEFLDRIDDGGLSDWGNIAFMYGASVERGQRFMATAEPALLAELTATGLAGLDAPGGSAAALNEESAGPVALEGQGARVAVLDRGTWAAFGQRHLLHLAEKKVAFYRDMLGMKDEAREQATALRASYGDLRLFPLAARRMAHDRETHASAMEGVVDLLRTRPDLVPTHHWNSVAERRDFPTDPVSAPPLEDWMQPLFPAGTYMEWPKRLWTVDRHLRVIGPELALMREAVPYSSNIAVAEVTARLGAHPKPADLRREYAQWIDFDVGLARGVAAASTDDPAEYRRLYEQIAAVDPEALDVLGSFLVERGDHEAAAQVYERYFEESKDRVSVCNSMGWLVEHHFKRGRTQRALEVAQSVAQTYCAGGLETLAFLYEDMGRFDDAYDYFQRELERYDRDRPMAGFLLRRHLKGDDRAPEQRATLMRKFFPDGLERWSDGPAEGPSAGLVLSEMNPKAEKAGLKVGDVIVGSNGYRVKTYDQYRIVRTLDKTPLMKLVVWRNWYLHLSVPDEDHWLRLKVRAHPGPDPGADMYV